MNVDEKFNLLNFDEKFKLKLKEQMVVEEGGRGQTQILNPVFKNDSLYRVHTLLNSTIYKEQMYNNELHLPTIR